MRDCKETWLHSTKYTEKKVPQSYSYTKEFKPGITWGISAKWHSTCIPSFKEPQRQSKHESLWKDKRPGSHAQVRDCIKTTPLHHSDISLTQYIISIHYSSCTLTFVLFYIFFLCVHVSWGRTPTKNIIWPEIEDLSALSFWVWVLFLSCYALPFPSSGIVLSCLTDLVSSTSFSSHSFSPATSILLFLLSSFCLSSIYFSGFYFSLFLVH